jgi:hypothetical protein
MPYKIGQHEFISLSRPHSRPVAKFSRETRPGKHGITLINLGDTAEPIQLVSRVETDNVQASLAKLREYEELANGNPVSIEWNGDLDAPRLCKVIDVQPVEGGVIQTVLGLGGVRGNQTSSGFLVAVWIVQIIDPVQQNG